MKSLHLLYHMAYADFLERVRRYSFLVMLGLVVWLGYASATGIITMNIPPNYVGEINSAWAGALMTVTAVMLLGWFGFYLVKGSVSRDYETGVGQIMATTPLSRPLYTLGKWLSNLAVLGVMVLILMVAGVAMNLLIGQAPVEAWALVSPLLFLALPSMAIVAAVAVLFETLGWLRGGFGNVVYFFLFTLAIIPAIAMPIYVPFLDWTGMRLVGESMLQAARVVYPTAEYGFNFGIINNLPAAQRFHYGGIAWTAGIILPRLFFVLAACGLALLASVFFDRFNTSRVVRTTRGRMLEAQGAGPATAPLAQIHLTPLQAGRRFRFFALCAAEFKMLVRGHRWWWYVVSLGLVAAQFAVPHEQAPKLLAMAWLWLILVFSGLGNREAQHNTREIVFSAPRPTRIQLPALCVAAITVVALMGSGALLRYLLDGDTAHLLAWLGGVLFIPSLALAAGVLTNSRKLFEVVYVAWMYIVLNGIPPLDFVGVAPTSPWYIYVGLAMGLLALAAFVRHSQVKGSWQ